MSRVVITPRSDRRAKIEKYKIFYGDDPALDWGWCEYDTYWNERGKIDLSAEAEQELMEAAYKMHDMSLNVIDKIIDDDVMMQLFFVNRDLWPAVRKSWKENKPDF